MCLSIIIFRDNVFVESLTRRIKFTKAKSIMNLRFSVLYTFFYFSCFSSWSSWQIVFKQESESALTSCRIHWVRNHTARSFSTTGHDTLNCCRLCIEFGNARCWQSEGPANAKLHFSRNWHLRYVDLVLTLFRSILVCEFLLCFWFSCTLKENWFIFPLTEPNYGSRNSQKHHKQLLKKPTSITTGSNSHEIMINWSYHSPWKQQHKR